jgi:hypothetical protein
VNAPYRLRHASRSVKLAVVLFLVTVGAAYVFAFLMVRAYAGLSPSAVAATYARAESTLTPSSAAGPAVQTHDVDLASLEEEPHRVDTNLLIQDSHVHLLLYAIVAALETLVILGLDWGPALRDAVIVAAFGSGLLDFAGQWLMHFGWSGFSWLTIVSGWAMAGVYVAVVAGTIGALASPGTESVAHADA